MNKFLELIRPVIAFELRKSVPEGFKIGCKFVKTITVSFRTSKFESVNNMISTQDKDLCESLLKFSKDKSGEISQLKKKEIINVKVSTNEKSGNIDKLSAVCELTNDTSKTCKYNVKNKPSSRKYNF